MARCIVRIWVSMRVFESALAWNKSLRGYSVVSTMLRNWLKIRLTQKSRVFLFLNKKACAKLMLSFSFMEQLAKRSNMSSSHKWKTLHRLIWLLFLIIHTFTHITIYLRRKSNRQFLKTLTSQTIRIKTCQLRETCCGMQLKIRIQMIRPKKVQRRRRNQKMNTKSKRWI